MGRIRILRLPGVVIALCLGLGSWPIQVRSGLATQAPRATGHAIATLNPGKRPEPAIADAAHHRIYIGTETGGSVTVVDDRIVKTIPVGREVEDLTLSPNGRLLYTASSVVSRVSVVNTSTLRVIAVVPQITNPSGLALDATLHRLYATEMRVDEVAAVDTRTNRVVGRVKLTGRPLGVGADTALHRVFVGLFKLHRVSVIDGTTNTILGSIQVGAQPVHPFRVDSSGHRLYVVNSGSSTLSMVDTQALRSVGTIATGRYPEGLAIQAPTNRAYVSNEGDPGTDRNSGHSVSVIDLRNGRVIDTLSTPRGPDGIAYDPNNGKVYVSVEDSGRVAVVSVPARDR